MDLKKNTSPFTFRVEGICFECNNKNFIPNRLYRMAPCQARFLNLRGLKIHCQTMHSIPSLRVRCTEHNRVMETEDQIVAHVEKECCPVGLLKCKFHIEREEVEGAPWDYLTMKLHTPMIGPVKECIDEIEFMHDGWRYNQDVPLRTILEARQSIYKVVSQFCPQEAENWKSFSISREDAYRKLEEQRVGRIPWKLVAKVGGDGNTQCIYMVDVVKQLADRITSDAVYAKEVCDWTSWRHAHLTSGQFENVLDSNMCGKAYKEHPDYQDEGFMPFLWYCDGVTTSKDLTACGPTHSVSAFYLIWDRDDFRDGKCMKWASWNVWPVAVISKKFYTPAIRRHIIAFLVKSFNGAEIPLPNGKILKPRILLHLADHPAECETLEVKNHAAYHACFKCDFSFDLQGNSEGVKAEFSKPKSFFKDVMQTKENFINVANECEGMRSGKAKDDYAQGTGILGRSPMLDFAGFNPVTCVLFDWMHCVDEGIAYDNCNALVHYIVDQAKICSFDDLKKDLEDRSVDVPFGDRLCRLKRTSKKKDVKVKAAESRALVFALEGYLNDLVAKTTNRHDKKELEKHLQCIQTLGEVYYLVFVTDSWDDTLLKALDRLLDGHRAQVFALYGIATPKSHYTSHFTDMIRAVGSLKHYMCYSLESYNGCLVKGWRRSNKKSVDVKGMLFELLCLQSYRWREYKRNLSQAAA
jgi:hypothetical protein